ncbi:adaptor protein MecA [Anaerotalea alkaliphila]|uniref:Adaptor protein MecA n=1 Tax=Anaerotalea alkaliphila TaxID=2662126 RepID=A0A7X5HTI3_9FIRM|nr:adaptor protein MecA [Anaerotalea alkaliphila]NDL66366.1 adaptor protein MecA [Anaerotalea alkaliphila]
MKIEKVNSNQIKCVLNKSDLQSREIKVSELAYGTEKAQALFRDMMDQASDQFGFDPNDSPLMIEAVPLSSDSIMLIITKVENPDELEDRFSNLPVPNTRTFRKREYATNGASKAAQEAETETGSRLPVRSPEGVPENVGTFLVYRFDSLNHATDAAKYLASMDIKESALYKEGKHLKYYLTVVAENLPRSEDKLIFGRISEYGEAVPARKQVAHYFKEHYDVLIKENAVKVLSDL